MQFLPEELFEMARNVQDAWFVKTIEFSPGTKIPYKKMWGGNTVMLPHDIRL